MPYRLYQEEKQKAVNILNDIKVKLYNRGWFPATSGNLSYKLHDDPLYFAITSSGKDKGTVTHEDVIFVDKDAKPIEKTKLKPSAETKVHSQIYQRTDAGCVIHIHTVNNNFISQLYFEDGYVPIKDMEMIKALDIWKEDAFIKVPIIENFFDLDRLAEEAGKSINPEVPGLLIRNHGIYAWGRDEFEAKRHVEAFEFIFEYMRNMIIFKGCKDIF
ncbi:MAG TPA: methylthioribulose 1-phosphate dehydratase [Persephonella sp.]|uniref:Methylthioribulose-1-phosphate dehydratase n=1 Tax=Persephonella marina (strain DSM 14350 / EX-H1) TaxID=123214 RepID=MTNB_PERMH|nr:MULTISPECIES: methylthioribulose 1-phosphate dehydratase [Persephonella]C0QSI8.1 RecName: Full=Methylthioribulose-1-phosphate dehydratase; Short=MTRu-1-P dehydratase [Persephonella marina EX-H1]ACO03134.1 methylthioribulose-1-phosphate dehydratase [Persephonella marina EX-H1]HCB69380.1 methylthioribulose 1-phosphate dehydratase [Persephonella sp.]